MARHDYAYPFRIDAVSGQAQRARYAAHVDQLIRQALLTAPGERADLPQFGCGLRQLIFAPNSEALQATARLTVQRALNQWLSDQIQVIDVKVSSASDTADSEVVVTIEYLLTETQSKQLTMIQVS